MSARAQRRSAQPRIGAFTLVELLVVIGLIAVLAAVLLPILHAAKVSSYAARSTNSLRQLVAANITYSAEKGFYVPADNRRNNRRWHGGRTSPKEPFDPARGFLAEYLGKSRAVTPDPFFSDMLKDGKTFEEGTGGYGYNASYVGGTPEWGWNPDGTRQSAVPAAIERPATTMMFATSAYARENGVQEYPYAEPPFWDFGDGPVAHRPSPTVHFRYNGRALVGWCDGHVSSEERVVRADGENPHSGNAEAQNLGWFGSDEENGFWNPRRVGPRGR